MRIMERRVQRCLCCMEEHEVQKVVVREAGTFRNVPIEYDAEYLFCDRANEFAADESQIIQNDRHMKDAYRDKTGLLTSSQIASVREKCGLSQTELCLLLGWPPTTVRLENHRIQSADQDALLRTLDADPAWFPELFQFIRCIDRLRFRLEIWF